MFLSTPRLLLRPFSDADLTDFATINADPEVMRHFPAPLSVEETGAAMKRYEAHRARHGFAMSAVILRESGRLIGVVGLQNVPFDAHFTPAVEVGWRLHREYWGKGLAGEAAAAAMDWGFRTQGLLEIVACTIPVNTRSRALMERLRMTRDPRDDFDHPAIPDGHPMRRHVLYRVSSD